MLWCGKEGRARATHQSYISRGVGVKLRSNATSLDPSSTSSLSCMSSIIRVFAFVVVMSLEPHTVMSLEPHTAMNSRAFPVIWCARVGAA